MLNINLTSRSSATVIGLLIFFVPFFTYLSPENLKQLSKSDVLEILLSLIIILIVLEENFIRILSQKNTILTKQHTNFTIRPETFEFSKVY